MGLANISVTPGNCPQDSVCDFESGACGWTVGTNQTAYKFKLIKATDGDRSSSSPYDHTMEYDTGHFMEATGGNSHRIVSAAPIQSFFYSHSIGISLKILRNCFEYLLILK